jgi:FAD/FMN-containing dehydrogenase
MAAEWSQAPDAGVGRRYVGRHDRLPRAVARCLSAQEVARALRHAQHQGMPFAVRSSGHSYADHSSTDGLLIDLSGMCEACFDSATGTVTVGSGQTLGDLSDLLTAHGRLVPGGSCPTVAIGGITLAGGFGFRGRLHGLTADNLVRAEVVLADGTIVTADAEHEADLFWALRGAGAGNFGVATTLTLKTHPLTPLCGIYAGWPLRHAVRVLDVWQHWAPRLPDDTTIEAYLVAPDLDDEPALVEVWGVGPESAVLQEVLELVGVPPEEFLAFDLAADAAARYLSGRMVRANQPLWTPEGPFERPSHAYVKSEFFERPLPVEALTAVVRQLEHERVYGEYRDLEFTPWGGAYARVEDSAFIHRRPLMLISHTVLRGTSAGPRQLEEAGRWLHGSWSALHPHGNGHVYQGYPDPELDDWEHAYYGPQAARLRRIKARYDPGGVFRFAQSLGQDRLPASPADDPAHDAVET